jgi:hypothetical protein
LRHNVLENDENPIHSRNSVSPERREVDPSRL